MLKNYFKKFCKSTGKFLFAIADNELSSFIDSDNRDIVDKVILNLQQVI